MEDAWEAGYEAGFKDEPYTNPYSKSSPLWDEYHDGYSYGVADREEYGNG